MESTLAIDGKAALRPAIPSYDMKSGQSISAAGAMDANRIAIMFIVWAATMRHGL